MLLDRDLLFLRIMPCLRQADARELGCRKEVNWATAKNSKRVFALQALSVGKTAYVRKDWYDKFHDRRGNFVQTIDLILAIVVMPGG